MIINCDKSQRWSISVLSFSLDNSQERNNRNSNFISIFIYGGHLCGHVKSKNDIECFILLVFLVTKLKDNKGKDYL